MYLTRRLLFPCLFALTTLPAAATHLVGGELGYRWLGETAPGSGQFRYAVDLKLYLNCGPNSNFQDFAAFLAQVPGQQITIGLYDQDPTQPDAPKDRTGTLTLPLIDVVSDAPTPPPGCTVGNGLCMLTGTFSAEVVLPATVGGHHLYYQLCCRSNGIINLTTPAFTGIAFHAFVPPMGLSNSSPAFLERPQVFLCIGDTSTYLNTAVDPDGDVLEYLFTAPYTSPQMESGIAPAVLPWPLPTANHQAGYSATTPMGASGHADLDATSGLAHFMPALQGIYTVAVQVNEYRNGQLIATTTRDVEVRGIPCSSGNQAPTFTTTPTTLHVVAGQSLAFDIAFADADGDDLLLNVAGAPLSAAPAAVIGTAVHTPGTVTSTFQWTPSCDQISSTPYVLSATATDDACPNAVGHALLHILVDAPAVVDTILGDRLICLDGGQTLYSIADPSPSVPTWTITNGDLVSGQGTDQVAVEWTVPGAGQVQVELVDPSGCGLSVFTLDVDLLTIPTLELGPDTALCIGDSIQLGTALAGNWTWTPTTGLDAPTSAQPFASPANTTTYKAILDVGGCSATDSVVVTVHALPTVDAGADQWTCPGGAVTLQGSGTGTATWSPVAGLDNAATFTPQAAPAATTTYTLLVTDAHQCSARDSATVHITVVQVDAGADISLCQGDTVQLQAVGTPGVTWQWTPADALDDVSSATPQAFPATSTLFHVTARLDTCTARDSVMITVQGPPALAFDLRAEPGCESVRVFARDNTGASSLTWTLGDGSTYTGSGFQHAFVYDAPIEITLTATDASGCSTQITHILPADTLPELTDARPMNVFTPNGDGHNDLFSPLEAHVGGCAQLVVMNRWGQRVFESIGNNMQWDGRDAAGQACVPGTYFFTFTLRDLQWQGTVELIR